MVQTVCLEESKHATAMMRKLKLMQTENDHCDFIVQVEGIEYRTHKIVLSAGSDYFKAMLKHGTKECHEGKVEMVDVDSECVKSCIEYIYSAKFDIPDGKIGEFIHVVIMMQLEEVKLAVSNIMERSLTSENFYLTRKVADRYSLKSVTSKCNIFYKKNFMAISTQPDFQNEKKSHILNVIKSKTLQLTEEEKLTITLRWVGDSPTKKGILVDLVKLIRLEDISSEYLEDLLENHPVIGNDMHLYKLINAPMVKALKKSCSREDASVKESIILFDRCTDSLQCYDPDTSQVTKFHEEKFYRIWPFTAVCEGSYVYALCQNKTVHRLNFKKKDAKWEQMQDMIGEHGLFPPAVTLSGSVFVIGAGGGMSTADVELFSPMAIQWLKLVDKPEASLNATLVPLGDSIYCIGGSIGKNRNVATNSFCRFTPSLEWTNLQPMRKPRQRCGAIAFGQRIYAIAGESDYAALKEVDCYDVNLDQWTSVSSMTDGYRHCRAFLVNGWIFAFCLGNNSVTYQKYDIQNDKWSKIKIKDDNSFEIGDSVLVKF